MIDAETIERHLFVDFYSALSEEKRREHDVVVQRVGPAVCLAFPGYAPPAMFNRALGLGVGEPATEATLDAGVVMAGFHLTGPIAQWLGAMPGRPGWSCYVAWDGTRAVSAGALHVRGPIGELGFAATLPEARGRGAQSAILAARIRRAADLGATELVRRPGDAFRGSTTAFEAGVLGGCEAQRSSREGRLGEAEGGAAAPPPGRPRTPAPAEPAVSKKPGKKFRAGVLVPPGRNLARSSGSNYRMRHARSATLG